MCLGYRYLRGGEEEKLEKLRKVLLEEGKVLLAVVFGSFVELESYRDVDVAVYSLDNSIGYLAKLDARLEEILGTPVDIVPLTELDPELQLKVLSKEVVVVEKQPGLYKALVKIAYEDMLHRKNIVGRH